jgi:hypothetical protein
MHHCPIVDEVKFLHPGKCVNEYTVIEILCVFSSHNHADFLMKNGKLKKIKLSDQPFTALIY